MTKSLIPKHIAEFLSGLKIKPVSEVIILPPKERFDHAAFGDQLELAGILYQGFCLMDLKEEVGHGNYSAELAARNMSKDRAWRAINLAKLSRRVSPANFAALRNLAPTKLAMLVNWSDEELAAFFSGKEIKGITYEDAIELPTREMDRRIKQAPVTDNDLMQANEKLAKALAKSEEKNKLLTKKHLEPEGFIYPASVEKVRIESSILASMATTCIDDLEQHMLDLSQASDLSRDKNKKLAEFGAGATALYLNIKAIQSKAAYLLTWFVEQIGEDYVTDDIETIPTMSEEEALRIRSMWEVMLMQHRAEQLARESSRKGKRKGKGSK